MNCSFLRHLPAQREAVLVETGEPEESIVTLLGDCRGPAVRAEELLVVIFIERDQARHRRDILECPASERCWRATAPGVPSIWGIQRRRQPSLRRIRENRE